MTDKPKPLVYVVGEPDDKVNVCYDCFEGDEENTPIIRNTPSFGDNVPYPECWVCEEVARPETLSHFDAELPEHIEGA